MGLRDFLFGRSKPAPISLGGQAAPTRRARAMRARYDAAQTTDDNRRHWANADSLAADAANTAAVRLLLRNRSRYEVANNSWLAGMISTLANDTIGTGPRVQMLTLTPTFNDWVEKAFAAWSDTVDLAEKLRTMRRARAVDGEAFGLLFTNQNLANPVKLDIRLVEADQITTPTMNMADLNAVDGIVFDSYGNPSEYHMLKEHPGSQYVTQFLEYFRVPAAAMIHWYRSQRPGQSRGIPDLTPTLDLFGELRRYRGAVIAAAETAADFSVMLQTSAPPDPGPDLVAPLDPIEFERRMMITMPMGWEAKQLEAQQPATTYEMFVQAILNEAARCLDMPFNVAACNSAKYNYASGRLDHQTYFKSIRVERDSIERRILNRIFAAWLAEFLLVNASQVPAGNVADRHLWYWDGEEHVDPTKESAAAVQLVEAGLLTEAEYQAGRGKDWEEVEKQRAQELGIEVGEYRRLKREKLFKPAPAPPAAGKSGSQNQDQDEEGSDDASDSEE